MTTFQVLVIIGVYFLVGIEISRMISGTDKWR